jgi:hypothetical protein
MNDSSKEVAVLERCTRNGHPQWFVLSAGAILALTGIGKLWGGVGNVRLLAVIDPVMGIQFRHLLLVVGAMELAVAFVCFFTKNVRLASMLAAWLATNFMVYRLCLWWMDWKRPCGCLGNLTDALHVPPQLADTIIKVVLAYLLIGSYGLLLSQWWQGRKAKAFNQIHP